MNSTGPTITTQEVWRRLLLQDIHIIDVRAPAEFSAGSIPGSVNHPILNDDERSRIGTVYKQEGSAKAITLGHELVGGKIKESRVEAWVHEIRKSPKTSIITCFRGGLRSQLSQSWLEERNVRVSRIAGGYKKMRQLFMDEIEKFCRTKNLRVLTGKTGAGKTTLLNEITEVPTLNLEFLAKHRGSAFGSYLENQPTQIDFENSLAVCLGRLAEQSSDVLVEDESRLIGRCVQPEVFFNLLRSSPVLFLEEDLETRVDNILQEYVTSRVHDPNLFFDLEKSLAKIKNKLGGLRYSEILSDMKEAQRLFSSNADISASKIWIRKLIEWYYDPMYEASFVKRAPGVIAKGNREVLRKYLAAAT